MQFLNAGREDDSIRMQSRRGRDGQKEGVMRRGSEREKEREGEREPSVHIVIERRERGREREEERERERDGELEV